MKPLRVLVVDDEPMMIEITSEMLRAFDIDVITASDGQEALRLAGETSPDIVLCDIMMPGMDGREVARRIREDPAFDGTVVVLYSSLSESEVDWRSSGAVAYREKGGDLRELPDFLRSVAARHGGS